MKATAAARPATAAPNRAQTGAKPNVAAKERTTSKSRPAPPSAEAVASAKRAASRIREAKEAQRTDEAAKASPPKRRVDPAKVKEKIVAADQKKKEDLIKSITKLKNFKKVQELQITAALTGAAGPIRMLYDFDALLNKGPAS